MLISGHKFVCFVRLLLLLLLLLLLFLLVELLSEACDTICMVSTVDNMNDMDNS